MFNWFTQKNQKKDKTNKSLIYYCKHCKLTCKECSSIFCYNCFMKEENPCPRCGKRNIDFKEKK